MAKPPNSREAKEHAAVLGEWTGDAAFREPTVYEDGRWSLTEAQRDAVDHLFNALAPGVAAGQPIPVPVEVDAALDFYGVANPGGTGTSRAGQGTIPPPGKSSEMPVVGPPPPRGKKD